MCRGVRTRLGCTKTQFILRGTGYYKQMGQTLLRPIHSKIRSYVHHYALIAEVVGKRERGNDLAVQKYKR